MKNSGGKCGFCMKCGGILGDFEIFFLNFVKFCGILLIYDFLLDFIPKISDIKGYFCITNAFKVQ